MRIVTIAIVIAIVVVVLVGPVVDNLDSLEFLLDHRKCISLGDVPCIGNDLD